MLYLVKRRIIHNGKAYNPGATVELDDKQAAQMVNGQIVPAEPEGPKAPGKPPETDASISDEAVYEQVKAAMEKDGKVPAIKDATASQIEAAVTRVVAERPKPPAIDLVNAALFLQSRGYKAETPEEAEKFVAGLSEADRASFIAELAEFEKAGK